MNTLYPIFLKLAGKKCIVVGGGSVAANKVNKLQESKADIVVISPVLTGHLEELAKTKSIDVLRREFRRGDLKDAFLVISATDSEETNRTVADEARRMGVFCNVVDNPALCDFYVPSVYQAGDLKIAISTNGKSPALARKIKEELGQLYGPEITDILESLGALRKKLEKTEPCSNERGKILSQLIRQYDFASCWGGAEGMKKIKEEIARWSSS